MEIIGEAFVSAMVELALCQLRSSDLVKFAREEKVAGEFEKLEKLMPKIQALLLDAEEKEVSYRSLQLWIDHLRDLTYDLEDLLDEFATRNLRQKLMNNSSRLKYKVRCFSFSFGKSPFNVGMGPKFINLFNVRMGPKFQEIYARLEDMLKQKGILQLREIVVHERKMFSYQRLPSSSLVEDNVLGRENDKEAIIELLFNDEKNPGGGVIPVCGMGGIGKTTLAQLVYNDETVTNGFDLKAWVYVSEDFDVVGITKSILHAICSESYSVSDLNKLQLMLEGQLRGKKFLLVLDDVWNQNYENWCVLRKPFMTADSRSKIIVTTRNEGVGSIMGTVATYHLKILAYEDCFSLFERLVFGNGKFVPSDLKAISEEIVKKCKGLPLAVKTMGGLLRNKLDPGKWEAVLNSKIWDLPEETSNIIPALRLSYCYLPSHLKRLFAYCSIFPKDYEFDKDELILLWMAEGFLPQQGEKKQVEDEGRSCFDELLSRSFFQQSSGNYFVMHDLIHDLAQCVARDICFCANSEFDNVGPDETRKNIRHLAFTRRVYDVSQRFKHLYKVKSLRTLLALPIHQSPWTACCYLSGIVLTKMLKTFRYLRSLCLSGYYIIQLPNSIGELKHLRYLNLSYTKIKYLPESVSNIVNLETLRLRGCSELMKLPSGICCLIHLYCLDTRDTNCLLEMPPGIGNLTSLRILTQYIVGKGDQLSLRELKDLCLRGELSIYGLGNVGDTVDATAANLKEKYDLDELAMEWNENVSNQNKQIDKSVLDVLRPHGFLKKLRISHYGGTKFPSWVGDPSFTDMVCLNLCNCRNIVSLPSLGLLPALRELSIERMDEIEIVGAEFYGEKAKPFPSLEILWFKNMLKWVHWSENGITEPFPHLHQLTLHNCPKLKGILPSQFPSAVKLTVTQCPNLVSPITFTCLLELNIIECNEVMLRSISGLSSLTTLKIRDFPECTCLPEGFLWSQGSPKLQTVLNGAESNSFGRQRVERVDVSCSTAECYSQLMSSVNPDSLCFGNLKKIPHQLHHLISLKYLQIESFRNLVSFPDTAFGIMLRHLILKDCPALRALPKDMMSCLEELEIEKCHSLKSFPEGKLPTTLKRLTIQYCKSLQSIPEGIMHDDNSSYMSQLEILKVVGCPSLKCSTSGKLPYGLKTLKISECLWPEPLTDTMVENSKLLEFIEISHCETLTTLPEVLCSLSHLTEIAITNCPNLISFPETGLPMSLQVLMICDCPKLKSFACLPPNLTSLDIWNCINLQHPLSKWNLHALSSLKDFSISGGSLLDEEYLLPGNLVSLCISKIENLETLSRVLNNLTLLEELEIISCHKLCSLPSEGLLSSLGRLRILDCPRLRKECLKWKGYIPCIELDSELI